MPADREEETDCPYLYNYHWRKEYLTDHLYRNLVPMIGVNSMAALPTILLNAIIIFAVTTKISLRSNSNILLACLAGTDLMTGLFAQPVTIAVDIERLHGLGQFCSMEKKFGIIALVGVSFASLLHLVLVCMDRYIATKHPLRYQEIVTPQRMLVGVLLAWAGTVCIMTKELVFALINSKSELYSVSLRVKDTIISIFFSACIVFIVYTYRYMYSETKRQKQRLQTEQLSHEEAERLKEDNKSVYTLAIIIRALSLTYLPAVITTTVFASSDNAAPSIINILSSWSVSFIFLGSLFNPIIYCWRCKKLRHAFLEVLHLKQPETDSPPQIEMQAIERGRRLQVQPISSITEAE